MVLRRCNEDSCEYLSIGGYCRYVTVNGKYPKRYGGRCKQGLEEKEESFNARPFSEISPLAGLLIGDIS